ncbi:MAG: multicopper oxidase domain-containing protein, partial [Sneathiella sp.]|nr:multicopper oxidase domain-containing protein [Sneathiella sp.]
MPVLALLITVLLFGTIQPALSAEKTNTQNYVNEFQVFLGTTINTGQVKAFNLTASPMEIEQGEKTVTRWAYNGQVPGPVLRVQKGDRVQVILTNKLPQNTTIHWHGVRVPNSMDGV